MDVHDKNNSNVKRMTDAEIEEYLKSPHASSAFKRILNHEKKMRLPAREREDVEDKMLKGVLR